MNLQKPRLFPESPSTCGDTLQTQPERVTSSTNRRTKCKQDICHPNTVLSSWYGAWLHLLFPQNGASRFSLWLRSLFINFKTPIYLEARCELSLAGGCFFLSSYVTFAFFLSTVVISVLILLSLFLGCDFGCVFTQNFQTAASQNLSLILYSDNTWWLWGLRPLIQSKMILDLTPLYLQSVVMCLCETDWISDTAHWTPKK